MNVESQRKCRGAANNGAGKETKEDAQKYNAKSSRHRIFDRIEWAIRQPIKHSSRIVLIGLVMRSNAAGECWPAMQTLADDTRTGLRTVERAIHTLARHDLIDITRKPILKRGKSGTRNHYRLNLETVVTNPPTVADKSDSTNPPTLANRSATTYPPVVHDQPANGGGVTVQGTTLRIREKVNKEDVGVVGSLAQAVNGGQIL